MNQEQQEQIAQKVMTEIVRLHTKLKEGGYSDKIVTADTTASIINDKLVYTDTLKCGATKLAEATRIDPRPLSEVKTELEAQKAQVQSQASEITTKVDEVLSIVEPELAKSVVEPK